MILSLFVIFALGPIIVLIFNSVKGSAELGRNPLGPPREVIIENYPDAWETGNFSTTVRNSLIIVTGTVSGVLLFGGMAAYSLAKLKLPRIVPNILIIYLLVISSLPVQLFLVPLFVLWRTLHLIDNLLGVIIIYIALYSPFSIFLMRAYIIQIPGDFEDAARIEGANEWQVFTKIVVPLSWPVFLSVGLIVSMFAWNEFLIATVFLTKREVFTVVTSYFAFSKRFGVDWGLTSAAAVMMIIPIISVFLIFQRRFIQGLYQGGIKG